MAAMWRLKKSLVPCLFEYVYFADRNTVICNISVYAKRDINMGDRLCRKINREWKGIDIEWLSPFPYQP